MGAWDDSKKKKKTVDDYEERAFSGTALAVRCYESHPVLKIGKGRLYGGSASSPVVKNADVYVSLQYGSTSGKTSDPWEPAKAVVEVHYSITDMQVPKDIPRFKKMITWLCNQLHSGKAVHVGCVGGHGRTGVVLSAIVAEALEKEDAIQYVRKHYCTKAVESKDQVAFLQKHYGVSEVEATKSYTPKSDWTSSSETKWGGGFISANLKPLSDDWKAPKPRVLPLPGVSAQSKTYTPMASARSLWKEKRKKSN